jgi:hypothetical protein
MDYSLSAPKVKHNRELTGNLPKHFNPEMLPDPREGFMLGLCARRGMGKSYLIYNLLKKFYKGCFDMIYIFNPSHGNDMTLSAESLELDERCFHDKIDPEMIQSIIDSQIQEKKDYDSGRLKKKYLSRILLVFDDCISDENFCSNRNTNILNNLAFKGRHFRISCIITSQYYNGFSRRFRVNVPNWILFRTDNMKERKSIIEEQGGICNEKKFEELFDYATREGRDFFFIYGNCPTRDHQFRRNIDNIIEY